MRISFENIRSQVAPSRSASRWLAPSSRWRRHHRNACNLEVAFCLPAQRMYSAGSVKPLPAARRRRVVRCGRDSRARLRHHGPPGGLAFHVAAGCLFPKGHWVNGRSGDPPSLVPCAQRSIEAIQRRGARFSSDHAVLGISDRACHSTGPLDSATGLAEHRCRAASAVRSGKISRFARQKGEAGSRPRSQNIRKGNAQCIQAA